MAEPLERSDWRREFVALVSNPPRRALIWILVLSVGYFLLAADVRYLGWISRLDSPLSRWCHDHRIYRQYWIQCGTEFGDGAVVQKFGWFLAGYLVVIRRWHYLPFLFFSVFLGMAINARMQNFFARPRPYFDDLPRLLHPGFPSGHVAGAVLIYGFVLILALQELESKFLKRIVAVIAIGLMVLVGVTRVGLLYHHATDVVGSFLWCPAWLIGCYQGNLLALRWSAPGLRTWLRAGLRDPEAVGPAAGTCPT